MKREIFTASRLLLGKLGINNKRWYRKLRTKNFTSGRLALGECNAYCIPGSWITIDIKQSDFIVDFENRDKLPFIDNSIDMIFSSHMIEHITPKTLIFLLEESKRVLKKGGIIRLEAPDCEKIYTAYKNGDFSFFKEYQEQAKEARDKFGFDDEYTSTHITFLSLFSCYIKDNNHVSVIATKKEIDSQMSLLSLDEFGEWAVSLQTPEQYKTHGHIHPLYPNKLSEICKSVGFEVKICKHGETNAHDKNILYLERRNPIRQKCSFVIEAVKNF